MSLPSSRMRPAVGCSKPAIIRNVVVFPQPDGPSSEKNSPAAMSRSMPRTATESSNDFSSPISRTAPPPVIGSGNVGAHEVGEPLDVAHEPVDVGLVVLDGEQPLLHLAPWRQEDAAVVLNQPVQVAEPLVDVQEVPVVASRAGPGS